MKKIKFFLSALVIAAVTVLASCTTFKAEGLSYVPVQDVKIIGHFEKNVLVSEFFGTSAGANLANISSEAMSPILDQIVWTEIQKRGGNGAINISIEYKATVLDMIANSITGSIWAPAHLIVSGDIIKY